MNRIRHSPGRSRPWAALLLFSIAMFGTTTVFAQEGDDPGLLIDLGNKKCPVMGGEVDGSTYSEWRGLRIGHCCGGCSLKLMASPEKYLDKTGIDWRKARAAVEKVNAASGAERAKLLTELERTYTVIRSPAPDADTGTAKRYVADLGNRKCPIMGGDVDGQTYTVWNGIRIGHCCQGCPSKFLKDPAKSLDQAGIEWKAAAKAVADLNATAADAQPQKAKALRARYNLSEIEAGLQIDLANMKCPIMQARTVNGKTYSIWNGLRVGHCCPGCSKRFLADPEKALDSAGIEWREAARTIAMVDNATGEKKQKLIREAKSKFKVLRAPGDE